MELLPAARAVRGALLWSRRRWRKPWLAKTDPEGVPGSPRPLLDTEVPPGSCEQHSSPAIPPFPPFPSPRLPPCSSAGSDVLPGPWWGAAASADSQALLRLPHPAAAARLGPSPTSSFAFILPSFQAGARGCSCCCCCKKKEIFANGQRGDFSQIGAKMLSLSLNFFLPFFPPFPATSPRAIPLPAGSSPPVSLQGLPPAAALNFGLLSDNVPEQERK